MITYLTDITSLKFPVALLEKAPDLRDDQDYIYMNGQCILKRESLLATFNINALYLPETYAYIYTQGAFLARPKLIKSKIVIDSNLNLFAPVKKMRVSYRTTKFISKTDNFFITSDYPCFIHMDFEKTALYPKICEVNNKPYLVGWVKEKIIPYETYI